MLCLFEIRWKGLSLGFFGRITSSLQDIDLHRSLSKLRAPVLTLKHTAPKGYLRRFVILCGWRLGRKPHPAFVD